VKSTNGHQHFEKESAGFGSVFSGFVRHTNECTPAGTELQYSINTVVQESNTSGEDHGGQSSEAVMKGGNVSTAKQSSKWGATLKASNLVKNGRDDYFALRKVKLQ